MMSDSNLFSPDSDLLQPITRPFEGISIYNERLRTMNKVTTFGPTKCPHPLCGGTTLFDHVERACVCLLCARADEATRTPDTRRHKYDELLEIDLIAIRAEADARRGGHRGRTPGAKDLRPRKRRKLAAEVAA